jgi:hypothetical protein
LPSYQAIEIRPSFVLPALKYGEERLSWYTYHRRGQLQGSYIRKLNHKARYYFDGIKWSKLTIGLCASGLTLSVVWHWAHRCLNILAPLVGLPSGTSPILCRN